MTEYAVPTASAEPFAVAVDGSGNVWFTEFGKSAVGSYNPSSNAWNSYSTPTKDSGPHGIAIGADGDPWFTEFDQGKVGTINAGTVIEYPMPDYPYPEFVTVSTSASYPGIWVSVNGGGTDAAIDSISTTGAGESIKPVFAPLGISSDSNGDVWYTSYNNYEVGEFKPGVGIVNYGTSAGGKPFEITQGPSGTGMWFTTDDPSRIGNIPPAGEIVWYTVPTSNSNPEGIVTACGNIWFAENAANKIGELNPSTGQFTEYPIPTTSSGPTSVTADNNGNVWFTEENGDKIAEVGTSTGPTPAPTAVPSAFFAAPQVGNQNYLLEFPIGSNGNVAPTTVISDPSGNPFFANPTDAVLAPNGDIISSADNTLGGTTGQVWIFAGNASGVSTPLAVISNSLFSCPLSLAIDGANDIYVLQGCDNNWATAAIMKFPIGSNGLTVTAEQELPASTSSTTDELQDPMDIASLSDGTLYVAQDVENSASGNPNGILEYSPSANGNVAPETVITGSNTSVGYPGGVAVDGSGNIYVLTRYDPGTWPFFGGETTMTSPSIVVYAAGSTGNATPKAVITSPDMTEPIRMRVDSAGDIYVADLALGAILYFPAGTNGQNVAPEYILSGSNTKFGPNNVQFAGI